MMEGDDDGDIGSKSSSGDDVEMTDDSSAPPDFALPPGGVPQQQQQQQQDESNPPSEDGGSSVTPPALSSAPPDPFDLLSMTDAAPVGESTMTAATQQPLGDFDLFSSALPAATTVAGSETHPPAATHDFFGGFETPATTTTTTTTAIDISSQESMMSSSLQPPVSSTTDTVAADDTEKNSSPQLWTAESGDLLGMGAPPVDDAATPASPPLNDFMDADFQSMPVVPPETTSVDPFANSDLFSAVANHSGPTANAATAVDRTVLAPEESGAQVPATENALYKGAPEATQSTEPKGEELNLVAATTAESQPQLEEVQPTAEPPSPASLAEEPVTATTEVETDNATKSNRVGDPQTTQPTPEVTDSTSHNSQTAESHTMDAVEIVEKTVQQKKEDTPESAAKDPPVPDTTEVEEESAHFEEVELVDDGPPKEAPANEMQAKRIKELEDKLAEAQQEVKDLQQQKVQHEKKTQESQTETAEILQELQSKLQSEVEKRAEAENSVNLAKNEIQKLSTSLQEKEAQWKTQSAEWQEQLGGLEKENEALIAKAKQELEDRKEHERRERVLANKLNDLKKKQATTTDVEEVYEDDLRMLKDDVATKTKKIEELETTKASLEEQLAEEKEVSGTRIEQLEKAVREEKHLNDERKKKMKSFIEAKAEELKEAKAESEHYQNELNSGNQGVVDLNNRWKTLHAQWVQSQTRNRELQRDLNKIKKDSENQHKVGDSLNAKLSSSAKETEQHKNKRLAAKQELMSVLGQLESEREITNKLRDSVRFTFTAKAQSQHQLLQENLTEFNTQLEALARRLGRPIPLGNDRPSQTLPSLVMEAVDESEASGHDDLSAASNGTNGGASKEQRRILLETTRLLAKLEVETQHISQGIMALTSCIEQMATLISGGGDKTCFTSLGDIFFGGGMQKAIQADQSRGSRTAAVRKGHTSHFPTEGGTGTMT